MIEIEWCSFVPIAVKEAYEILFIESVVINVSLTFTFFFLSLLVLFCDVVLFLLSFRFNSIVFSCPDHNLIDPKNPSRKKYPLKVPFKEYDDLLGMPESIEDEKCYSDLKESFIKESCRQILEGLLYLQRSRVPYPHLHTGNVMVQVIFGYFSFFFWIVLFLFSFLGFLWMVL